MALPHEVLGVAENADEATINAAFREAAKRFHPDLNDGDVSGIRQLRRLIWAREFLRRHKRHLLNGRSGRPRLPFVRKRRSFRNLYFACAAASAASVLSATILFADLGAGQPETIGAEKTDMAAAGELPDAEAAGIKAIRDLQEASYAPVETEMSAAPEPQLHNPVRRRAAQPGYTLKKAINRAAFLMSKTFRSLSLQ